MFDTTIKIFIFVFGMGSALFTSIMNMPLTWKVYKYKNTESLSILTLILTLTACLVWIIYASLIMIDGYVISKVDPLLGSLPILISNTIIALLVLYMLSMKMKNDAKAKKLAKNPTKDSIIELK